MTNGSLRNGHALKRNAIGSLENGHALERNAIDSPENARALERSAMGSPRNARALKRNAMGSLRNARGSLRNARGSDPNGLFGSTRAYIQDTRYLPPAADKKTACPHCSLDDDSAFFGRAKANDTAHLIF